MITELKTKHQNTILTRATPGKNTNKSDSLSQKVQINFGGGGQKLSLAGKNWVMEEKAEAGAKATREKAEVGAKAAREKAEAGAKAGKEKTEAQWFWSNQSELSEWTIVCQCMRESKFGIVCHKIMIMTQGWDNR